MIFLRFDTNKYSLDIMNKVTHFVNSSSDDIAIGLPSDIEILFDMSSQELHQIRDDIDRILKEKEKENTNEM